MAADGWMEDQWLEAAADGAVDAKNAAPAEEAGPLAAEFPSIPAAERRRFLAARDGDPVEGRGDAAHARDLARPDTVAPRSP